MDSVLWFLLCRNTQTVSTHLYMIQHIASHPMIGSSRFLSVLTPSSACVNRLTDVSFMEFSSIYLRSFETPAGVWLHIMLGIFFFLNINSFRVSSTPNWSAVVKSAGARFPPCLTLQQHTFFAKFEHCTEVTVCFFYPLDMIWRYAHLLEFYRPDVIPCTTTSFH